MATGSAQDKKEEKVAPSKWEYKVQGYRFDQGEDKNAKIEADLNKLATDGWEFAAIVSETRSGGGEMQGKITTLPMHVVLKRAKTK